MSKENSGFSCNYYVVNVDFTFHEGKKPYVAECGEIAIALGLDVIEMGIFKEIWRQAAARKGLEKEGNTALRGAEKILWSAQLIWERAKEQNK